MLKEFRDFAMRGNVVDLAVGVIIGAAFGTIASSLVDDIIMPPIGMAMAGIDFAKLAFVLQPATVGADGKEEHAAVVIAYGKFLNALIKFVIIAWVLFMIIKAVNTMKKKEEAAPTAAPPEDIVLLREIRDALNK